MKPIFAATAIIGTALCLLATYAIMKDVETRKHKATEVRATNPAALRNTMDIVRGEK